MRLTIASLLASLLLAPTAALAQATRTWVSGVGDDANQCSRTAPCKTFAGAIFKTAAGGEIDVLDPGGFNTVTISKSIVIDGTSAFAGVLASGTTGIVVNAGPSDVVVLRGLLINGTGSTLGTFGIRYIAGGALHVEDCVITNFSANGILANTDGGRLYVKNTTIRNIAGPAISLGNSTVATIAGSQLASGTVGLDAAGSSKATIQGTVVTGFTTAGVRASGSAEVNLDHGLVSNNAVGIQADSTVRLSEVMVSDNGTGIAGNVASFGNNRIAAGNGTDGAPAATLPQQ